jgi:competence protein ComEC
LALFVTAALWIFALLAGLQVPVVRCTIMVSLYAAGRLVRRGAEAWNSLGLAGALILLADPFSVGDASFLLSFCGVAGLMLLVRPISVALGGWTPVAVSVAAWLATLPISLVLFHRMAPVAILANLLVLPFIWVMLFASMLLPFHWVFGFPLRWGLAALNAVGDLLRALPGSHTFVPDRAAVYVVATFALLIGWGFCFRGRPNMWRLIAIVPVLAAICFVPAYGRTERVAVLDVGHGTCVVLEGSDGTVVVYDCGSNSWRDPGFSLLAGYLWSRGIMRVDALVLSHGDRDHVNGAATAIEMFGIRHVYVSEWFSAPLPVEPIRVRRPVELSPWAVVQPPPNWPALLGRIPADNDCSLTLLARLGGCRIWLAGDAEDMQVRGWLLEDMIPKDVDVLLAPHHGRWFGEADTFARACRAGVVLVSGSARCRSRRLEEVWRAQGAWIRATAREGVIVLDFGNGQEVPDIIEAGGERRQP